ncbi:MAG TPA: hypothetical protein VMM35_00800 [Longimicrobiales bacterium]|nr:hypothetical protein [Longimicrobiales bacterium]
MKRHIVVSSRLLVAPESRGANIRAAVGPAQVQRLISMLAAVRGVVDRHMLLEQACASASWEGFVIEQILGHLDLDWLLERLPG